VQPLEVLGAARDDAQHIVRLAGGQVALGDFRHGGDRLLEGAQIAIGLALERDADDEADRHADLGGTQHGGVTLDDPALLEQPHAAQAGRFRQPDTRRERRIRQLSKNSSVLAVYLHNLLIILYKRNILPLLTHMFS